MMCLQEIKRKMLDRNISAVAKKVGMTQPQLWRILNHPTPNPTIKTIERLSAYLDDCQ